MIRTLCVFLTVTLLSSYVSVAFAAPPTRFLQAKVKEARQLLGKKVTKGSPEAEATDEQLRVIIDPLLDFDRMSENALRSHWPSLSDAQKKEFIALFRALLFHSYLTQIRQAQEMYTVEYESEEAKGPKAATVTAIARTKRAEIELFFHLLTQGGQVWVVEDIVIDEVSLVENYREQFNRIMKKDGFSALLTKMADRLVALGGKVPAEVTTVTAKAAPAKVEVKAPAAKTQQPAASK